MHPPIPPPRTPAPRPGGPARVIQGSFLGGSPRLAPPRPGTVQAFQRPGAFPLPPTLQLGRPGAGQRLPETVQRKMESLFGTDFSDVRIHVGPQAASIGALAFTHGSDLYFAPGQYDPRTPHGQRLLGHELAHVVQQRAGRVRNPLGAGVAIVHDLGLEAEAERMGLRAGTLPPAVPAMRAMPSVQASPRPGVVQPVHSKTVDRLNRLTKPHRVVPMRIKGSTFKKRYFKFQQSIKRQKLLREIPKTNLSTYGEIGEIAEENFWTPNVGYQFEDEQDATIGGNFPAIDSTETVTGGLAGVSLKTTNLMWNYQDDEGAKRLIQTLDKYLKKLVEFQKGTVSGSSETVGVLSNSKKKLTHLVLRIAYPGGSRNAARNALEEWARKTNEKGPVNKKDKNNPVKISVELVRRRGYWLPLAGNRFEVLEKALIHGREPSNFPTIDKLENRQAISLKSMDLVHNYWKDDEPQVNAVYTQLKKYIDALWVFWGGKGGGLQVKDDEFDEKVLRVAIPENSDSRFEEPFRQAQEYVKRMNNTESRYRKTKPITLEVVRLGKA